MTILSFHVTGIQNARRPSEGQAGEGNVEKRFVRVSLRQRG
jgi:hypothetical protein